MSATTAAELARETAAANAATGRRFCRKCYSFKPFDGGHSALDARRRAVWRCASCTTNKSGQAPVTAQSSTKTPITRSAKNVAGVLSPAWKAMHAPLPD